MRVAVTGASGFIGGAVATALAERGHEVTGFGRRPAGWAHLAGRYVVWDITVPTSTTPTSSAPANTANDSIAPPGADLGDFDAVVHSAALADDWASLTEALRVNRLGTRNVRAAFPGARIVHLSTSSVYDAFLPTVRAPESAGPATRFLSTYSESKAAAEAELAGADAVILRPHAVYGPGDTTLLPRVAAAVRGGVLRLPVGGEVLHTLTHIDNLVAAAELALTGPTGTYNIGDDGDARLDEVLREFLDRRGRREPHLLDVRLRPVPYSVAYAAAAASEAARRASRRGRPRFTRYAISQLGRERTLDLTAARTALGYRPTPTTLTAAEHW